MNVKLQWIFWSIFYFATVSIIWNYPREPLESRTKSSQFLSSEFVDIPLPRATEVTAVPRATEIHRRRRLAKDGMFFFPKGHDHDPSKAPDHAYGFQDAIFDLVDGDGNYVERKHFNIIWHFDSSQVVESRFLNDNIFRGIGRQAHTFVNTERDLFMNDSVISEGFNADKGVAYLKEFRERGHVNIGVLIMASEYSGKDPGYAAYSDYHLRNYYFPDQVGLGGYGEHVIWIPNGFADGLGVHIPNQLTPVLERQHVCGFIGDVKKSKPWRVENIEIIQGQLDNACHIVKYQNFKGGMGHLEYGAHMEQFQFALILKGNNFETIRLYDALELGCIPIVVEHAYLDACFKGHPFLVVKEDWSDVGEVLKPYLGPQNRERLHMKQIEVLHFWQQFVFKIRTTVAERVDRSYKNVYGRAC